MAVVTMPEWVVPNGTQPFLRDFGSILTPFLGGPEQRINRVGTRFGVQVTLPPMPTREEALIVQSRLLRGREDRLSMEWLQPDLDIGSPGSPTIASSVAGGKFISLAGLKSGYRLREGQFISISHGGRSYLYMVSADAVSSGSSTSVAIWPMLRTSLSAGDAVSVSSPKIEGLVSPGDEIGWQIAVERMASFSFILSEGA